MRLALLVVVGSIASSLAHAATTYTYDDLGRLSTATYDNGRMITYTYDAAGNRTQVVVLNGSQATSPSTRSMASVDSSRGRPTRRSRIAHR